MARALYLIERCDADAGSETGNVPDQDAAKRALFKGAFEGHLTIEGICDGVWSTAPNKWDSLLLRHGQCEAIEFDDRRWTDLRVDREQLIAVWPQLSSLSPAEWNGDGLANPEATPPLWHCLNCFAYVRPRENCPRCGLMLAVEGKDYGVEQNEGGWEATTLGEILAPPHQSRFAPTFAPTSPIAAVAAVVRPEPGCRQIVEIPRKMGRPQKYNWEAAYIEVIRLANGLNGLPETQAELVVHLQEWFRNTFDKEPPESSIQAHVRQIYQVTHRPEQI